MALPSRGRLREVRCLAQKTHSRQGMAKPGSGFKTSSTLLPLNSHTGFRDQQTRAIDKVFCGGIRCQEGNPCRAGPDLTFVT